MPRELYGKYAGFFVKFCLLVSALGFGSPIGAARPLQDDFRTHPTRGPRSQLPIPRGGGFDSAMADIDTNRTDLRSALRALSSAAHLPIDDDDLDGLGPITVTLPLHRRTAVQTLRAIMTQVPGGGFVIVDERGNGGSRGYVLKGSGTANPGSNSNSFDATPFPHGLSSHRRIRQFRETEAGNERQEAEMEYIENELLLEFSPELDRQSIEDIVGVFGGQIIGAIDDPLARIGYYRARFPEESDVRAIAPMLLDQTPAKAAELNYLVTAMAYVPNDPFFFRQWGLIRTEVPVAWEIVPRQRDILVAVLDSGVDPSHPELAEALTGGWDFIAGDDDPFDEEGHGTAMIGIIAAARDNEQGIAGVAPGVRVMPVRVLNGGGKGSYAEVMRGLVYAADRGARVINMSFGGYAESRALSLALTYAHQKGALLIAAAGNEGINARVFPAADPTVIGVASTSAQDERSKDSNWGSHVLVAAPGQNVPTLLPDGGYALVSGTSPAAAHVTGIAALVLSVDPTLRNTDCANLLVNTAEDLGAAGWDQMFGFGQINAAEAVQRAARL